jgi:hypothetical protein
MQPHLLAREKFFSSSVSTSLAVVPKSPDVRSACLTSQSQSLKFVDVENFTTCDLKQRFPEKLGNSLYILTVSI